MKSRRVEKLEELMNKSTICKSCQNKDSCNIVENNIIFCTAYKESRTSVKNFIDLYECRQGHKFGVKHFDNELYKSSIFCPVCNKLAFFKEVMKIEG
ncbi:MAG: hypothetical protein QXP55_00320 [Nitrososphaerales archaeon]